MEGRYSILPSSWIRSSDDCIESSVEKYLAVKINLICVGKIKEKYLNDAINEYAKRLKPWANLNIIEVEEGNFNKTNTEIREIEGDRIRSKIKGYLIVTCIDGQQKGSEEFSKEISKLQVDGVSEISIVIGGSVGLSEDILGKADYKLSFSKMTFPHQLFRVMMLEQLYRAFSIINNSSYHK